MELQGSPEHAPPSTEPPASSVRGSLSGRARGSIFAQLLKRVPHAVRIWRLYWLRFAVRVAPTEAQRLFGLTVVIGAVCGLAAVAFHLSIRLLERLLIEPSMAASGRTWMFWTVATPTIGAMVCGLLLTYVFPNARGSGIPQVKATFASRGKRLRLRDSIGKFLVGSLQIGSGGSLGREGPTVQICAGIASGFGRLARVSPRSLRRLIPVGAAAGIAAAFNAPIAAVTFTIEEVVGNLDKSVLSGVIVAAALAAAIERSVLGEHPIFDVAQGYGLHHASSLVLYAILGVVAALVSVIFTDSLLSLRLWFRRAKRIPVWAQPGVGGMVTGILAVAALQGLKSRGVTGGGYETLAQALSGKLGVEIMLVLGAMKICATVFSYSSGGAGGIFAPSLFIGGMLGGAFGALDVGLFHHEGDAIGAFALVGMGAVFAGIIRAPMTSVLIIVEMTGGYSLILPLMIANMTAYGLARHLRPAAIYEALLEQDGIELNDKEVMDVLEVIHVAEVFRRDDTFASFAPSTSGAELSNVDRKQELYPVVDAIRGLVGLVTDEDLRALGDEPNLNAVVTASDLMRAPVSVRATDDLHIALETMAKNGLGRLPVLDPSGRVLGFIDEGMIAKVYLHGHSGAEG